METMSKDTQQSNSQSAHHKEEIVNKDLTSSLSVELNDIRVVNVKLLKQMVQQCSNFTRGFSIKRLDLVPLCTY